MSSSLGNLYFELGLDDKKLEAGITAAHQKLKDAFKDTGTSMTMVNVMNKLASADLKNASAEEKRASALLKTAKAQVVNTTETIRAAAAVNAATLSASRNAAVQQSASLQVQAANNAAAISAQRLVNLQTQNQAAIQRMAGSSSSASSAQRNLAASALLVNKTFTNQRVLAYQLANALGTTFSLYAVGAFIKKLAQVTGEFELQKVALQAIVRDTVAANKIFEQVKVLSVESPFQFKDLIGFTKQLAAFSVETASLFETTKRLADVSAGLGVDMGRIVLAYGQVRAATVLRGQELRQFTEAGIPLVDKLAEKFSKLEGKVVTAGDVFEKISNRMVSFKMVDEIFTDLTSSGGMFFEMQKKQADTLAGKLSNLQDAYEIMLSSMGNKNDSVLKGGLNVVTEMMRNWETIVQTIKNIVVAYGTYKTIMFGVMAYEKLHNAILVEAIALRNASALSGVRMSSAMAVSAAQTRVLTGATLGLNTAMKANVIAAVIAGLVALGTWMYDTYQKAHQLEKELNKIFVDTGAEATATVTQVSALMVKLKDSNMLSDQRAGIIKELNSVMGTYLPTLIKEGDSYDTIKQAIDGATFAIYENARAKGYAASITSIQANQQKEISEAESGLRDILTKDFKFKEATATNIIREIFGTIRENPEIARSGKEVMDVINSALEKANNEAGIKISPKKLIGQLLSSGAVENAYKYAKSISVVADESEKAKNQYEALGMKTTIYTDALTAHNKVYEEAAKKISVNTYADTVNGKSMMRSADILEIKRKRLEAYIATATKYGIESDKIKFSAQLKDLDTSATELGRLEKQIRSLASFKAIDPKFFNMESIIQDGKTFKDVSDVIKAKYEEVKKDLEEARAVKSGIKNQDTINALQKEFNLYKDISQVILGQRDKKEDLATKRSLIEKDKMADAQKKLDEQFLADRIEIQNKLKRATDGELINEETSLKRSIEINKIRRDQALADLEQERIAKYELINEAAGTKKGEVAITPSTVIFENKKIQDAVLAEQEIYEAKKLDISLSYWDGNVAAGIKASNKLAAIQEKQINDSKTGQQKEIDSITEKYRLIAIEEAKWQPDPIAAAARAKVRAKSEANEKIEVEVKYNLERIDLEEQTQLKLNEIKFAGVGSEEKLAKANLATRKAASKERIDEYKKSADPANKLKKTDEENKTVLDGINEKLRTQAKLRKDILDAVSGLVDILDQNKEALGLDEKQIQVLKDGVSVVSGIAKVASGDVVGGVVQIAGSMAKYLFPVKEKLSEGFVELHNQIKKVIQSINIAGESLKNIGVGGVSKFTLSLIQRELDDTTKKAGELSKTIAKISSTKQTTGTMFSGYSAAKAQVDALEVSVKKLSERLLAGGLSDDQRLAIEEVLGSYNDLKAAIDAIIQDLTGTSVQGFSDSLAEIFWNGIDAAEDWGQAVDDIIKKVIINQLTSSLLTKPIQAAIDQLVKDAASGTLVQAPTGRDMIETNIGLSTEEAVKFKESIASITALYAPAFESARKVLEDAGAISPTTATAKAGLSADIQGIKEDTAQLLSSLLNAIRGDVSVQALTLKAIAGYVVDSNSINANSLAQLVKIESNTYNAMMALNSVIGSKGSVGAGLRVWA